MKHPREASAVKPVIETAKKVAEAFLCPFLMADQRPEPVDVVTRLRAAICLGEEAGLNIDRLMELERDIRSKYVI